MERARYLAQLAVFAAFAAVARAQSGLADASLEQLLNTQVTSVSKEDQDLARVAASVFVISREDIRRSGATNLPDVLRMVPGVEVAQIEANTWAISIRGFNQRFSDKVLVLVDGRSVYTPSFHGVYWDDLDMPLETIERIEVIRGPGASVWGVNAVNGVIDIITRTPESTKGGLVSVTGDTQAGGSSAVEFSDAAGSAGAYRVFAKYSKIGQSETPGGGDGHDSWSRIHGGFRSDWTISPADSLVVEGEAYSNHEAENIYPWYAPVPGDDPHKYGLADQGADLLARWTHAYSDGSSATLQAYYDDFRRNDLTLPEHERSFDIDFQHHFAAGKRHDINWGLEYRAQLTAILPGYAVTLNTPLKTDAIYSAFFRDQIALGSHVWLTVGAKLEYSASMRVTAEPSARIAWAPDSNQTFWASASKAVRQPSRVETGVSLVFAEFPVVPGTALVYTLYGNPGVRPEDLHDYEIGYRRQLTSRLSFDIDSFLSFYRDLITFNQQAQQVVSGPSAQVVIPIAYGNSGRAIDYGGEASLAWRARSRWSLAAGYSMVAMNYRLQPGANDTYTPLMSGSTPRNSFQVRSRIDLTRRLEFDQSFYWNEALPNGFVPRHARLDARLAWKPGESLELSLAGQNLLRPAFLEFTDLEAMVATESARTLVGKITWRF